MAFTPPQSMSEPLGLRVHPSVFPSEADLREAREKLSRGSCPRRYCWYWHTLSFDWELSPGEGCEVADRHIHRLLFNRRRGEAIPPWQACCRATGNPGHPDYYEPREPHLEEDGWPAAYFSVGGKSARRRRYERRKSRRGH